MVYLHVAKPFHPVYHASVIAVTYHVLIRMNGSKNNQSLVETHAAEWLFFKQTFPDLLQY